jgi:hypothetical protein
MNFLYVLILFLLSHLHNSFNLFAIVALSVCYILCWKYAIVVEMCVSVAARIELRRE